MPVLSKRLLLPLVACVTVGTVAGTVIAADEYPFQNEIGARKALMNLFSFNLGQLGAMAKGEAPYDADTAGVAAENLLLATRMKQSAMWPAGSDASADGLDGKTRAKAEIWGASSAARDKHADLLAAAESLAAEAGNGLDALRGAIGDVGNGCKGCHDDYRMPKKK